MELLTPWHLLLVILAFVLLFGYKRLPDASRSIGRSLRIFRGEMQGMSADADGRQAPAGPTPDELEAEARAAEARAAELRAQVRGRDQVTGSEGTGPNQ